MSAVLEEFGGRVPQSHPEIEVSADERAGRRIRGAMLVVGLLYLAMLVLAPLGGIIYFVIKAGWPLIQTTLQQPDVSHALFLTFTIMALTVIVTAVFGVIVALVVARDE